MFLLVGGTGNLGGRIARRLSALDLPFRALVRPTTDPGDLIGAATAVDRGDLRDASGLRPALEGIDTVIASAHTLDRIMAGHRDLSIRRVDRDGYGNLVSAATAAGVRRFVYVSFPGAILGSSTPFAEAKLATEALLRESPMHEVIVRPDAYQEPWLSAERGFDWRSGGVTIFGRGDGVAAYVGMDDVAEAVVRLATLSDPPRLVEFGGPEVMSRNELVIAFEKTLGAPLRRRHVPRLVMRLGSVALRPIHPALASVLGMGLSLDLRAEAPNDRALRELGIRARPVSAYIHELVEAESP
ncbi:MAG TPA: NAD(P)H-binding protein [Candidatus Limnocylindrales bacterium]|nr:NAD(P)H-binding protein [Candidatus Limnocylindrales bacterium]